MGASILACWGVATTGAGGSGLVIGRRASAGGVGLSAGFGGADAFGGLKDMFATCWEVWAYFVSFLRFLEGNEGN